MSQLPGQTNTQSNNNNNNNGSSNTQGHKREDKTAELIKISAKSSYSQTMRGEDEASSSVQLGGANQAPHHSLSMSHHYH